MALPSGTYSNTNSGALQVFFSGEFTATSFDFGSGSPSDIVLKCTVTDGSTTRSAYISSLSAATSVDWDYVADTTLTCEMTEEYWHIDGAGYVTADKLRIRAILVKK